MFRNHFTVGWRNLDRNKIYSLINITGLALSMSCGILIFTIIKHHLSFDNFHSNSDRIYRVVTELHRDIIAYRNAVPSPLGEFFRNDYTVAEKVARIYTERQVLVSLKKSDDMVKYREPQGVSFAEKEFFDIFNFPLILGDKTTALTLPNTTILTERIARKYFGDKSPIGQTFWLENKIALTVTGVLKNLPANTDIKTEIFVSYPTLKEYDPWLASDSEGWNGIRDGMRCYTLLKTNTSPHEVEEILQPYVKRFRPNSKNVHHYKLQPLADVHFNEQYDGAMKKQNLWILAAIGVVLIATACVNFINLATAQALRRAKEVGVRKVLGSLKRQLFWQFMIETAIITASGILFAAMLSYLVAPHINDLFNIGVPTNFFTDWIVILFCLTLGLVVTLLAGYYPALILAKFKPVTALKGRLSQQSIGGFSTRRLLIVTQFAISQLLIIGTVVTMNQIRFAKQADLGFDKEAIVMISTGTDRAKTRMNAIKNEMSRIAGVEAVSLCFAAPAADNEWGNSIKFDNSAEEVNFRTSIKSADADYVSTFDLELVAGRNLKPSDTVTEMLVNEAMVEKLNIQSPEEAIGRMISANGGSMKGPIVGVLKNFHDKSFHEAISPILITTYSDDYSSFAVKLKMEEAKSILTKIEKIWGQQYPNDIFEYEFLDNSIAKFYETEEIMLRGLQLFSFIAIFIGCLGLYGLVSFMVTQKTKEIGIRKVLGGSVTHVLWIFGKEFGRLILIAFLIAAPIGGWIMYEWLQGFAFKIEIDASTFALAIGCSIAIAALTVSYQVIKTALTNPVDSLRSE